MLETEVKYCPHCATAVQRGDRFGRERPYCPECGWVFFQDPRVAVVVLIQQDDRILLVKRANDPQRGKWTLPGGFMDAGEDPQEAAVRECLEETGLEVCIVDLLDLEARPALEVGANLVITYLAERVAGQLTPGDDAEHASFFALGHLPALAFQDAARLIALIEKAS